MAIFTYFNHDIKIKKQSELINDYQIKKLEKDKSEEKKGRIEANVIKRDKGKRIVKIYNKGKSIAKGVNVNILESLGINILQNPCPIDIKLQTGIDITKDVVINVTQEHLEKREVNIQIIHNIFSKVNISDKKNIVKALKKNDLNIVPVKNFYIALFVNVEKYQEPYFVIGIELTKQMDLNKEHIKTNLNKYFYKHVEFKIFEIIENNESSDKLIEQGEKIMI